MTDPRKWLPIEDLPKHPHKPGRVFVVVEGECYHSEMLWGRIACGDASTRIGGFKDEDICRIEDLGGMDRGSGVVTHWMRIDFPQFPQYETDETFGDTND